MAEIGLFPLGIVLLPGERIPLHIFEPRYKELINECLALGTEFGLILSDDTGTREVGTRASVIEELTRFPDGRLNVMVEGTSRFRLAGFTEGRSFMTAETRDFEDSDAFFPKEKADECLEVYRRAMATAGVEAEDLVADRYGVAFQIASRIPVEAAGKQDLLEMASESERLQRVEGLIAEAVIVLRRRLIAQRASHNGQVDHP
jgi:Lon protease-like protein